MLNPTDLKQFKIKVLKKGLVVLVLVLFGVIYFIPAPFNPFIAFLIIGSIHGLVYFFGEDQIFGYNWDWGYEHNPSTNYMVQYKNDKRESKKLVDPKRKSKSFYTIYATEKAQCWLVERKISSFLGVFLGWLILWFLLDKRLQIFCQNNALIDVSFADFVLLLLAWIGINGRLPSIAHKTVDIIDNTSKALGSIRNKSTSQ